MTVEAVRSLLADLGDRGVKVEASSEGQLRFTPRSEIDKLTFMRLRLHKQTLLSILQGIPVEDPPDDDVPLFTHKELERASELGLVAANLGSLATSRSMILRLATGTIYP